MFGNKGINGAEFGSGQWVIFFVVGYFQAEFFTKDFK